MDRIDFRSDTVTWPTPAMRQAMVRAPLGDDVYGEDPTVNELEALAAAMTGKEAGLFVSSGTMGNLVAILSHATRGDEAILGQDSHVFSWEAGSMAALGGVTPYPLPTDAIGRMDPAAIAGAVRDDDPHLPRTRLVLVENSYGAKHGYPLPPEYLAAVRRVVDEHGLAMHMDGARLFNAAVAQNLDATDLTRHVDSVTFCLSKGLCAPVGSVLCGSDEFIYHARRIRKALGGGMRQAGVIAAAGIVALNEMVERLGEDHARARQLAERLALLPEIVVEPDMVRTNMVFFALADDVPLSAGEIADAMAAEANVYVGTNGGRGFRAVTHYWIGDEDVQAFADALTSVLRRTPVVTHGDPVMTTYIGQLLNRRYRLDALLGDGGMGTVYRGYDLNLERSLAIKLMHAHFARQEEFRARLVQEARTAAQLDHPSIVRVYDFGDSEQGLFIAMEYVDGGSLRDHLRRLQRMQKFLPLTQSLQIAIQIAEALDYAHRRKIVHRDVKPGNIILKRLSRPDEAGAQPFRALLTDFGLVKLQESDAITQSGTTVGTPTYMSPEQCEGKELDGRSDLYSLGIVLYELVTNKLPFTFNTLTEAISTHQAGTMPQAASEIRPEVPPIIDTLLERALIQVTRRPL